MDKRNHDALLMGKPLSNTSCYFFE